MSYSPPFAQYILRGNALPWTLTDILMILFKGNIDHSFYNMHNQPARVFVYSINNN